VLHMLRRLVGDDKFFLALNDYRACHQFRNSSTGDLREAFERSTAALSSGSSSNGSMRAADPLTSSRGL
jgi:aminopeptidase N